MTEPLGQDTTTTGQVTEEGQNVASSMTTPPEPMNTPPKPLTGESGPAESEAEKTLPIEPQMEAGATVSDNLTPSEPPSSCTKFYSEEMDAIVTVYPDGTRTAVSAHPPTVGEEQSLDEKKEHGLSADMVTDFSEQCGEKLKSAEPIDVIQTTETIESALEEPTEKTIPEENKISMNFEESPVKESDNTSAVPIDVETPSDGFEPSPSVAKSDTNLETEHETAEDITEPVMHVVDPCTEVPEPVGTPQTSRSKISESRGGDNGPELNLAELVDGVEVREATLEDILVEKEENVETKSDEDRPKRPPPPVVSTTVQGVTSDESSTKKSHGGFHFRFGGGTKSREASATRDGGSPDRQTRRTLGASVKTAFGTLTRSIKKKQQEIQEKRAASKHATMDARVGHSSPPCERSQVRVRSPSSELYNHEEQSLQSVSGVGLSQESSIQGTPSQKQHRLIKLAAHDFQRALPPEDHMTDVNPIYVNHEMQPQYQSDEERVLSWTAASVATSGINYNNPVEEEQIRPMHVARSRPQQVFLDRLVTEGEQSAERGTCAPARSPGPLPGSSPKPPRPISRPVLSPLDYQTFHSEDSLQQPDAAKRRVDLISNIAPSNDITVSAEVPFQVEQEQIQPVRKDPGTRNAYRVTASLDRRQYDSIERYPERDMRRAQTMRTADYASRLRERLRTFRGDSTDGLDERGGTLRVSKVRSRPENYVCSETIHWPRKLLKLKRRQTAPPAKQVFSTPNEAVIPRPQPRAMLAYQQPPSPQLARSPLVDNVIVNQTVQVQGKPPRAPPVNRPQSNAANASAEFSVGSSRQLTSLQTLAASPKLQRYTTLPDSPQRGLIRMMDAGLGSPTQMHDVTNFPYLSNELMTQVSQHDQSLRVDAETLQNSSDDSLIKAALTEVHPFQSSEQSSEVVKTESGENEQVEDSAGAEQNEVKSLAKSIVKDFLTTCVRLRSVDLQGHYAAFHYPLRGFDSSFWNSCARFVDYKNMNVMQEPGYTTEYVQLPIVDQNTSTFVYAEKPVDALLTTWLDCHQTVPPSEVPCSYVHTASGKIAHIYHPISFAVRLDQLLSCTQSNAHGKLSDTCFRLAVLLAYAHCRHHRVQSNLSPNSIVTDPKQILLILSTSNCLALFKTQSTASNETESGTDELVKYVCPDQETVEQGIDTLIEQLNKLTGPMMEKTNYSSRLLKAVAPPDWMAICCSRIYLKQQ